MFRSCLNIVWILYRSYLDLLFKSQFSDQCQWQRNCKEWRPLVERLESWRWQLITQTSKRWRWQLKILKMAIENVAMLQCWPMKCKDDFDPNKIHKSHWRCLYQMMPLTLPQTSGTRTLISLQVKNLWSAIPDFENQVWRPWNGWWCPNCAGSTQLHCRGSEDHDFCCDHS